MSIPLIVIIVLAVVVYLWYASLIKKKNQALEALSGIDVQLTKRHDLIPNVLTIAKKFMEHEKGLIEEVTKLRTEATKPYSKADSADVKNHLDAASALQSKMGQLMVAVEAYPNLKSDQTMVQAQQTYNEVEEHIAAARRFYNSAVNSLNTSIQIFPGNLIAGMAGVKEMPSFVADEATKGPVNAGQFLN